MSTCPGCGGVVGRDCWNPQECAWITRDMAERYAAIQYDPAPCQGCHAITSRMLPCLGICEGLSSDADVAIRAALWRAIPVTFAATDEPDVDAEIRAETGGRVSESSDERKSK